jgi:hypothetical protein
MWFCQEDNCHIIHPCSSGCSSSNICSSVLNLPRAYANAQPIKDGKTARQLLVGQLDILDREYKSDSQRLMAHGRFLQDTFGQNNLLVSSQNKG